ncbi:unnamed protein product [Rodentolepis nana]|uniref:Uncharacterized protein n=1 Tax=Rodentolepis nana TaxID=102285 RepID=A0A3P7VIX9_RODNA|nr:unnamed protein product [Rodentolepis nana]
MTVVNSRKKLFIGTRLFKPMEHSQSNQFLHQKNLIKDRQDPKPGSFLDWVTFNCRMNQPFVKPVGIQFSAEPLNGWKPQTTPLTRNSVQFPLQMPLPPHLFIVLVMHSLIRTQ